MVVMHEEQFEYPSCHRPVYFKMVKMANFMYILQLKKNNIV